MKYWIKFKNIQTIELRVKHKYDLNNQVAKMIVNTPHDLEWIVDEITWKSEWFADDSPR